MTDASRMPAAGGGSQSLELGGLRFEVSFRSPGATLRVLGPVGGSWRELLRFDDFVEHPHYHAPASGDPVPFDRSLGEPLAWFVGQLRDHLWELLERSGFAEVAARVDLAAVTAGADRIREAMVACGPAGYERVPGLGLQRAGVEG